MGTKVELDNYLSGHQQSMRDLSRDSNGGSWPAYYGGNNFPNGNYYFGFSPRAVTESFPVYDREVLKQTMLEHETVFKNQVFELHRLYRVQRELMDEVKRKEQYKQRTPYETSSSSSPLPPQMQSDSQKRDAPNFPVANPLSGGLLASRSDGIQSSAMKFENGIQAGPIMLQNSSSPKGSEVSDSRPTKHRRKMFDLQLPAEEYIDTDEVEQFRDGNVSSIPNHLPVDIKGRPALESGANIFPNHSVRVHCNGDATGSSSSKPIALADLNEPVQAEETTAPASVDRLGSAVDFQLKGQSSNVLGLAKDSVQNARNGNLNGISNNFKFDNKGNGPGWLSYGINTEQNKGNMNSINLGVQPEKALAPSLPVQQLLDQAHQPTGFLSSDHTKLDCWRPKANGLEASDRSHYLSHVPSQRSYIHSSDVGTSWKQSVSSWGKMGANITQRSQSVQAGPSPYPATISRSSQSSNAPNNECFGSMWHLNGNARQNSGFGTELPLRNGFYQGCPSSFKEPLNRFPSVGTDHVGSNNYDKSVSVSGNFMKAQNGFDMNSKRELNLNIPNGFSSEWTNKQGVKEREQKQEDPLAVLPWLKSKGAPRKESSSSRNYSNALESTLFRGPLEAGAIVKMSCNGDLTVNRHDINISPVSKKIMGVPIFEKPSTVKNEAFSITTNLQSRHHVSRNEDTGSRGRKRLFDINAPCDAIDLEQSDSGADDMTVSVPKGETGTRTACVNSFDLNACIIEDEEVPSRTFLANSSVTTSINGGTGIDLEAPVVMEDEDYNSVIEVSASVQLPMVASGLVKESPDRKESDLAKSAAEAIVTISSIIQQKLPVEDIIPVQVEAPTGDPLSWFVDVACSCSADLESQLEAGLNDNNDDCLSTISDSFEALTLQLPECTAEEYMPVPSTPDFPVSEAPVPSTIGTRTRRGHARRGRQKRDFQRDILPGLASLSRHEVTEDLQTFGGLMRATGHAWQSGSRRGGRGGCRGRRRAAATATAVVAAATTVNVAAAPAAPPERTVWAPLKQQLNSEVASLEWGKTIRRPRRQRCAAGNPTPVTLT